VIEAPAELKIRVGETAESSVNVYDDERPLDSTLVTTWSVVAGNAANIEFADNTEADTSITVKKSGSYILRITASDGERYSAVDIPLIANPSETILLVQ
jgi:beta-L-arabinobiosidase